MGLYNVMFYGGLILAVIFLILSVVIFFVMHIQDALGVVTGNTQKKAIEEIRSGGTAGNKKRKGRGIIGNIQARDVDVFEADKKSGILNKSGEMSKKEDPVKRSSDASDSLSRRAAEDAKAAIKKDTERARRALDEESTEILTYNDMKREPSEDTTSILENEQATDVLTAEDEYDDGYTPGDDDATDVLTSDDAARRDIEEEKDLSSYDDEATDILRTTSKAVEEETTDVLRDGSDKNLYNNDLDDDYDPEIDKTDVLTADSELSADDIYGTYNPELTAVLRSDMAPGEDALHKRPRTDLPGITVLYSETIVHTDESL